jgi:ankyrin repeat protein
MDVFVFCAKALEVYISPEAQNRISQRRLKLAIDAEDDYDSLKTVEELVTRQPQILSMRCDDAGGFTPLHIACARKAKPSLIRLLIDRCRPEDLRMTSDAGLTPLHVAFLFGTPVEIIRTMIEKCPETLRMVSKENLTALHWACFCRDGLSLETIRTIVELWPAACLHTTDSSRSPYDLALERDPDNDAVLDFLFSATHDAA